MKKLLLLFALLSSLARLAGQSEQMIGLNLNQIPATSLDISYQYNSLPWFSIAAEAGTTLNYERNFDLIGYLLSSHVACSCIYDVQKTSGGHLKMGLFLNFRKQADKTGFFKLGLFLNQALVHQEARMNSLHPEYNSNGNNEVSQTIYLPGVSGWLGYDFRIYKKLSASLGMQLSYASKKSQELYGSEEYIPGMGANAMSRFFPMLMVNLNYRIK
jgi:hypothetical protein